MSTRDIRQSYLERKHPLGTAWNERYKPEFSEDKNNLVWIDFKPEWHFNISEPTYYKGRL